MGAVPRTYDPLASCLTPRWGSTTPENGLLHTLVGGLRLASSLYPNPWPWDRAHMVQVDAHIMPTYKELEK